MPRAQDQPHLTSTWTSQQDSNSATSDNFSRFLTETDYNAFMTAILYTEETPENTATPFISAFQRLLREYIERDLVEVEEGTDEADDQGDGALGEGSSGAVGSLVLLVVLVVGSGSTGGLGGGLGRGGGGVLIVLIISSSGGGGSGGGSLAGGAGGGSGGLGGGSSLVGGLDGEEASVVGLLGVEVDNHESIVLRWLAGIVRWRDLELQQTFPDGRASGTSHLKEPLLAMLAVAS